MDTAELINLKGEADIERMGSTLDENTPFEFREGFPRRETKMPVAKVTTVTITIRTASLRTRINKMGVQAGKKWKLCRDRRTTRIG